MKIVFDKLWRLLKEKNMKRIDLLPCISNNTLAKLGKDEIVTTESIMKICDFLQCQPGEIMEFLNDDGTKPFYDRVLEAQATAETNFDSIPDNFFSEVKKNAENNPENATEIYQKAFLQTLDVSLGMPYQDFFKSFAEKLLNDTNK